MTTTLAPSLRASLVARELSLPEAAVAATLGLLDGGATVPFIARYRKEATQGLDDGAIARIAETVQTVEGREGRRASILRSLEEQGVLTPELAKLVKAAKSLTELEDLYGPYRPKRRTKGQLAKERGLGPLAELLLAQSQNPASREALAQPFIDAGKSLPDVDAVLDGACDLVAELVAEKPSLRAEVRSLFTGQGQLTVGVARGKSKAPELAKYQDHVGKTERAETAPSHRVLAAERGEAEGLLSVGVEVPRDEVLSKVRRSTATGRASKVVAAELERAFAQATDKLLMPSLETEYRRELKAKADAEAIRVFAQNLEALLLAAPLGGQPVVAIDPGLRTGCKVVALDGTGDVLAQLTIYPHTGQEAQAGAQLAALLKKHPPKAIAIGNGTAGRETETFVRKLQSAKFVDASVKVVSVSEAGASVYSASELARAELPELDVSLRGAVSIGRRLQDPLAELVKVDPKSIGVGQYQHDVDQTGLGAALERVVETVVNRVGVDLNTASPTLLQAVAGLGPALAKAIVEHRAKHGPFETR